MISGRHHWVNLSKYNLDKDLFIVGIYLYHSSGMVPGGGVPVHVPAGNDADNPTKVRLGHGVRTQNRAQDLIRLVVVVAVQGGHVEPHQLHALGAAVHLQLSLPPERNPLTPLDVGVLHRGECGVPDEQALKNPRTSSHGRNFNHKII